VTFQDILYEAQDGLGVITLNRPQYRNAQSWRMLDEIDQAFDLARADKDVRVVVMRGSGGVFSTGHDLGTPEGNTYRAERTSPGVTAYDSFKKYNLDLLLKWRNFE
jgi:enoyl-CoA hydratase